MRIIPGGLAAFNSLAYGNLTQDTVQFFQHQLANAPQVVGEYGNMFRDATKQIYTDFISSEALEKARLALLYSNQLESHDVIRTFTLLQEFQAAQAVMQRWIMANPVVGDLYNRQLCDGFSDTYVSTSNGKVGHDNYDYRRVMDGIVDEDKDGNLTYSLYFEDLKEGDIDLHVTEQSRILTSWDIGNILIKQGLDITNPSGGNL